MTENEMRFLKYRDVLEGACLKGYFHFQISKKLRSDFLRGYNIFKINPRYWFLSWLAHSECAFSYIIRIIEKRYRQNPDNITIHKLLNLIEQDYRNLFANDKWEVIRKQIIKDKLLINSKNKIIDKLMAIRDKTLFHFDRASLKEEYFREHELQDEEVEELYLVIERLLNKYSLLIDGTKNLFDLSSIKGTIDEDFKAFEE